jgi:hypothetical protein
VRRQLEDPVVFDTLVGFAVLSGIVALFIALWLF